ncbi:MAG: GNAT family N-acetyltransferase [Pseudomonadota bacterium]
MTSKSAAKATNGLTVDFQRITNTKAVEKDWVRLEQQVRPGFFASWPWIETLISRSSKAAFCTRIYDGSKNLVAMGMLGSGTEKRHGFLVSRQLRLNEAYCTNEWAPGEYTALLAESSVLAKATETLFAALKDRSESVPKWDELVFTDLDPNYFSTLSKIGRRIHLRALRPTYCVNLAALKTANDLTPLSFAKTLGKSTRAQLSRSIRLFEASEPVQVERATSPSEAQTYFDALAELNDLKQRSTGGVGIARRKALTRFHAHLIAKHYTTGTFDLWRIRAGDQLIGFIYCVLEAKRALFYAGGFKPYADNRLKPGLTAHAAVLCHYANAGYDEYDFLAGDARYKRNLGAPRATLHSIALQRLRPGLMAEATARGFRNRFR